jgi:hypothetical protein
MACTEVNVAMSVAEARNAVAKARLTLENTSPEVTVPFIVSALEEIVKALEELETRVGKK